MLDSTEVGNSKETLPAALSAQWAHLEYWQVWNLTRKQPGGLECGGGEPGLRTLGETVGEQAPKLGILGETVGGMCTKTGDTRRNSGVWCFKTEDTRRNSGGTCIKTEDTRKNKQFRHQEAKVSPAGSLYGEWKPDWWEPGIEPHSPPPSVQGCCPPRKKQGWWLLQWPDIVLVPLPQEHRGEWRMNEQA